MYRQQQREQQAKFINQLRMFLTATSSDAKVTVGELTYTWKQAGSTAEITRTSGTDQPIVWQIVLADKDLRFGIKHADRVEWLKEPPAVWEQDREYIKMMFVGT